MSKVFAATHPFCWLGMTAFFLFWTTLAHAAKPVAMPTPPSAPAYHAPEYFFNIDLDPRYQFTGTGALTEADAAKANCYRFLYNSSGKLQEIEYRRAGILMLDPDFGVARIDFEYQPGVERRWFRDPRGQPMRNSDGVYGEELALNPAGFPTGLTNLDDSSGHIRNNIGVTRYARTLDEHNRVIVARRLGLFGTPITDNGGFYETHTSYDDQGHTVDRSNYEASGKLLNNDDGVAQVRSNYTLYPDSTQIIQSYFDAASLPVEEKSDGIHQRQTTFDHRDFLIDESCFDGTGAPTVTQDDGVHERRYTYDDRGNQLSEEFLDVNGQPVDRKGANASDYAKVEYKYDDKNRVVEELFLGDDGKPQINSAVGAAMIRQEYNKHGDLVRRLFLDGQGHPSQHVRYLAPAIRSRVDGDTTTVFLRNEADQPTKNPINGYSALSYKTATDHPLSPFNKFYDIHGRQMSKLRVFVINPHLHKLRTNHVMKWNARLGAAGAGLGSLLACWLALRKSSYTKRRKVYVPTPVERFLGWFAVLAIFEGTLRFFLTLYWAWIGYENGQMSHGFYVLEGVFLLFMFYRLYRQGRTMRVLNIERDDMHRLVKDFFAKANLKAEWVAERNSYITPPLDLRLNYFLQKFHAYLAFISRGDTGQQLERDVASYLRAQAGGMLGPAPSRGLALYYPLVALCYFLLSGMAFYTLYQLLKG